MANGMTGSGRPGAGGSVPPLPGGCAGLSRVPSEPQGVLVAVAVTA